MGSRNTLTKGQLTDLHHHSSIQMGELDNSVNLPHAMAFAKKGPNVSLSCFQSLNVLSYHIQPTSSRSHSVDIEEIVNVPPNEAPKKSSQILELSDGSDDDNGNDENEDPEEQEESAEAELGQVNCSCQN